MSDDVTGVDLAAAIEALADDWQQHYDDCAPNAPTLIYGDGAKILRRTLRAALAVRPAGGKGDAVEVLIQHFPIVTGYADYPSEETLRCKCQSEDDEDLDGYVYTSDGSGGSPDSFDLSYAEHVATALAARAGDDVSDHPPGSMVTITEAEAKRATAVPDDVVACAWCPLPAKGVAHHNDGAKHPSCGEVDHGFYFAPDMPVDAVAEAVAAERERIMGIRVPLLGRAGFSISLAEFEQAYHGYGHDQSAERVCERGGFALEELTKQLGHAPRTVRPIPGDRFAYRTQRSIARASQEGGL